MAEYLTSLGVDPDRLLTEGKGLNREAAVQTGIEDPQMQRLVEVSIIAPAD